MTEYACLECETIGPERPVADFMERPEHRFAAVSWAAGVIADLAHYSDDDITRAAKTLAANDPARRVMALEIIKMIDRTK